MMTRFTRRESFVRLMGWMGPWTAESRVPKDVVRRVVTVKPDGVHPAFESWLYRPSRRPPGGAIIIAHGLHHAGPADPRMDRFCRVLASSGILAMAPFLPDYMAFRLGGRVREDFERAFDSLLEQPEVASGSPPGVFSISFGSLPALQLVASRPDDVAGLMVFGGYADCLEVMSFALGEPKRDGFSHSVEPLNRPVVFMNMLDAMDDAPTDLSAREALIEQWRTFIMRTWGRPEMKSPARHVSVAESLAAELPPGHRQLFREGCGIDPGGVQRCLTAIERFKNRAATMNPGPCLSHVRCPVHLVHGRSDDVIPYTQSYALSATLPAVTHARVYLTGLYDHTRPVRVTALLAILPRLSAELRNQVAMARALVSTCYGG